MKREAKEKYAEISEAIEQAEKAELDRKEGYYDKRTEISNFKE